MEHVADEVKERDEEQSPSSTRRPNRRRKLGWGFVLAGLAIVGAIVYLVVANTGASAEYYMTINELRACTTCAHQTVRVAGIVAPNSIVRNDATRQVENRSHPAVGDGIDHRTPSALRYDVAAPFQTREMVADAVLRQSKMTNDLAD